jgi:predicted nucleotidyltransferase component of viral defense system
MLGWLKLTDEQRRTSLAQAAIISGITAKAIEKDWWVTLTIKALFESPYAKFFIFKGGTSLSKGWKLIERFSEDIDIALDPLAFGKEYKNNPSHTYVKTLKKDGCEFTSTVLLDALKAQFVHLGIPLKDISIEAENVDEKIPDKDPQTLFVKYKSLYPPHGYIADEVKVEFSVRSLKDLYEDVNIESILSNVFPNIGYEEIAFKVVAAQPRKTFLEKVFLLHEKFQNLNPDKIKIERLSRHLYDLVKIMDTEAGKQVLKDYEHYRTLVEHRRNYIRLSGVDYDTLNYSTLSFIPPDSVLEMFRQDYGAMQAAMIYGESPDFDTLIEKLRLLTGRFRLLNEYHQLENIIKDARDRIHVEKSFESEGSTVEINVSYLTDLYKPAAPTNKSIAYTVKFIRKKNKWAFEKISIK